MVGYGYTDFAVSTIFSAAYIAVPLVDYATLRYQLRSYSEVRLDFESWK